MQKSILIGASFFIGFSLISFKALTAPVADLVTGDVSICPGTNAELVIELTGAPPWTLQYTYNVNDTLSIPVNASPYSLFVSEEGLYELIDVSDQSGEAGSVSGTSYVSFITIPSAILNGSSKMCQGGASTIPVDFNSGTPPWSITYTLNSITQPVIHNITSNPYNLPITTQGQYVLTAISDANCTGVVAGTYNVTYYDKPTGNILGDATICQGQTTPITFALTGTAPWQLTYSKDGITQGTISGIASSPHNVQVSEAGVYRLVSISDANCSGNIFGQATIQVLTLPNAQITGLNSTYSVYSSPVPLTGTPSGGVFSGPGVVAATSTFYPNIAGTAGSPHPIVYLYTNGGGCSDTDTAWVNVIDADAEIIIPNEKAMYCFNDDTFSIRGYNASEVIGWFSISGGVGLTDNGDNTAIINPSVLNNGTFTITYTYYNGTYLSVYKDISVQYINPLQIIGLSTTQYCQNAASVFITGNTSGGVFSGPGVIFSAPNYYFIPSVANIGNNLVLYSYTSPEGCMRSTSRTVNVKAIPVVNFAVNDSCVIDQGLQATQFINQTTSLDPVTSWAWSFGDINSGENNYSTIEDPSHTYFNSGPRNISLTASTASCNSTLVRNIDFGDKPFADFYWSTECFDEGIPIDFTNQTTCKTPISNYQWRFYNESAYDSAVTLDAQYLYPDTGEYLVELIVSTAYNCSDTFSKSLVLKPTYKIGEQNYLEDFEGNKSLWSRENERLIELNQWQLGSPDGNIIDKASSGNTCWFTNIQHNAPEKSWIMSPCFDFTGVDRPIIRFDLWQAFLGDHDGAVLQATSNSGRDWVNIGTIDDGINWYNTFQIYGMPGNQSFGWANQQDNDWVLTSHSLDEFKDQLNIQFRFAYGSDGITPGSEGLALDDIFIGESKKILLLENFVNSSQELSTAAEMDVQGLVSEFNNDLVTIQYHTGFEGNDSIYSLNRADVNARSLFYGISSSPYVFVDGGVEDGLIDDYSGNPIEKVAISKRSLEQPFIDFDISAGISENQLTGKVRIEALQEIPVMGLNLQIALLEKTVTTSSTTSGVNLWHTVMCKLLPDGGGTSYYKSWDFGEADSVFFTYAIPGSLNKDSLVIVAFLQDEVTKDVIQARANYSLTDQIVVPKSFKQDLNPLSSCEIYPNPTNGPIIVHVRTEESAENSIIRISISNTLGQVLKEYAVPNTSSIYSLQIDNLPPNIYILSITFPDGKQESKKLIKR